MGAPNFKNFTAAELTATAGGDPWTLNDELQSGQPGAINDLADAFHIAGGCVSGVEDDFTQAKQKFQQGWRHNGNEHPINASAEVARVTDGLKLQRTQLAAIAASLENVAGSLAQAQTQSDGDISQLNNALREIDEQITAAKGNDHDSKATQALHDTAVQTTKASLADVQRIHDGYVSALKSAETSMAGMGYVPAVIDPLDGQTQDSPSNEADKYKQLYLARDQALVQQASASGATDQTRAAAARLGDYDTLNNPNAAPEAKKFAAERLNDYRTANFVGPVDPSKKDPIFGTTDRERAQGRLKMQQLLGNPRFGLAPDQVTKMIDGAEGQARVNVLNEIDQRLRTNGVSPEGARAALSEIEHGEPVEKVLNEVGKDAATEMGAGGEASKYLPDKLPQGRHWQEGIRWSPEDIKAFSKITERIGYVGTAVDFATRLDDMKNGANVPDTLLRFEGSLGGTMVGAKVGAMLCAPGGPEAAFVCGLAGGIGGAWGGEKFADKLTEILDEIEPSG